MKSSVVLGRKHCSGCRCWRPVSDFSVWTDKARGKLRLKSVCRTCDRLRTRERLGYGPTTGSPYGRSRATHCVRGHPLDGPGADVFTDRRGKRHCRACKRIRNGWPQTLEYNRIYQEGRRRAAGIPRRNLQKTTLRRPGEQRMVPVGPFREWLRDQDEATEPLAQRIGMDPRQVRGYLRGEFEEVNIDTVDRVFVTVGEPMLLRQVYPELYEGMAK